MRSLMLTVLKSIGVASVVALLSMGSVALAQDQKVIVTVNDQPITSYDIQQRINLWKILGDKRGKAGVKKQALNELIDDIAVVEETKKLGFPPSEKEIDQHMKDYSKGLKTDDAGLKSKLKAQGISTAAMRQYLAGRLAFNRLVRGKFKEDFSVSEDEVKKRVANYKREVDGNISQQIAKLESDPRRKPITVYEVMPIKFPIDAPEGGVTKEIVNSRAIEVAGYVSRFRSCKGARAAASGIFNVQIGKKIDANAAAMNPKLRQALDKVGPGRALGPISGPTSVEAIAFCGKRTIRPAKIERPKNIQYPTADQIRNLMAQEKFDIVAAKYSGRFRKGLLIEYRDPTYSQ
jgi:peptidyl-prolyl cis-trans isomerase SurA